MNAQMFPNIGDKLFLIHREIVVTKVYSLFRFATVRYLNETTEFCVDICALSDEPNYTNSISLCLLRGNCSEQHNASH